MTYCTYGGVGVHSCGLVYLGVHLLLGQQLSTVQLALTTLHERTTLQPLAAEPVRYTTPVLAEGGFPIPDRVMYCIQSQTSGRRCSVTRYSDEMFSDSFEATMETDISHQPPFTLDKAL